MYYQITFSLFTALNGKINILMELKLFLQFSPDPQIIFKQVSYFINLLVKQTLSAIRLSALPIIFIPKLLAFICYLKKY